jgi:Family of unknown function (DUF6339)
MNLQFVSREVADNLANHVDENVDAYLSGQTTGLVTTPDTRISRIDVSDPPRLLDENGECRSDVDCTQLIYQWLSGLTPVQAADSRLWIFLTHCTYAEYMLKRWVPSLARAENKGDVIIDRWFFRGEGARTKMHNGVARLWWFGHVTHDLASTPFELTETLLSLQDIQTAILERSLGRCPAVVKAVLQALRKYWSQLEQTPQRGNLIQEWAKDIRLRGGAYLLDVVPEERLTHVVETSLRQKLAPIS